MFKGLSFEGIHHLVKESKRYYVVNGIGRICLLATFFNQEYIGDFKIRPEDNDILIEKFDIIPYGKGIGSAIIRRTREYGSDHGYERIIVKHPRNLLSMDIYLSMGFTSTEEGMVMPTEAYAMR